MRQSKDPKLFRYEMVRYAARHGVKPAARMFNTTPKTVRKWFSRRQPGSLRGLEDRRKHKTRNDLREIKAGWRLFEQVDIDTKHLYDIPEYWLRMKRHNPPRYHHPARRSEAVPQVGFSIVYCQFLQKAKPYV